MKDGDVAEEVPSVTSKPVQTENGACDVDQAEGVPPAVDVTGPIDGAGAVDRDQDDRGCRAARSSSPTSMNGAVDSGNVSSGEDVAQVVVDDVGAGNVEGKQKLAAAENQQPVELSDETKEKIVKQVEFYFSDENLPTDKFMQQKMRVGNRQQAGAVALQVVANFNKVKKLCTNHKLIAQALMEGSEQLVVEKKGKNFFLRRKTPFKLPDKDGMSDIAFRTVQAVNIPKGIGVDSLKELFGRCGVVETVHIVHKNDPRQKDVQQPRGVTRDVYASCQYATPEEAIKAVKELTDNLNWRGGLRVTLQNGMSADKATKALKNKSKADRRSAAKQEEALSPAPAGGTKNSNGEDHVTQKSGLHAPTPTSGRRSGGVAKNRERDQRSRSLTPADKLGRQGGGGGSHGGTHNIGGSGSSGGSSSSGSGTGLGSGNRNGSGEEGEGTGAGGKGRGEAGEEKVLRKPRSKSIADGAVKALSPKHGVGGESGRGGTQGHLYSGVIQTIGQDGQGWIKGENARRTRLHFAAGDVLVKDGVPPTTPMLLKKGDRVEYRAWRDKDGRWCAVLVEKKGEKPQTPNPSPTRQGDGRGGAGGGYKTDRPTQANFRMAVGPDSANKGFLAGRGRGKLIAQSPTPPSPTDRGGEDRGGGVGTEDAGGSHIGGGGGASGAYSNGGTRLPITDLSLFDDDDVDDED